jgi:hypothetical protein
LFLHFGSFELVLWPIIPFKFKIWQMYGGTDQLSACYIVPFYLLYAPSMRAGIFASFVPWCYLQYPDSSWLAVGTQQFFFLCVWYQGLNSGPIPWTTLPSPFYVRYFRDRVSRNILPPGWRLITILLISTSWVARITGVSDWCLAQQFILLVKMREFIRKEI